MAEDNNFDEGFNIAPERMTEPIGRIEEPDFMYPYGNQGSDTASVMERADPSKIIDMIKHHLRGEIWEEELNKWVRPKGRKPLVNELGVNDICVLLYSNVNLNTSLSYLGSMKDVQAMTRGLAEVVRRAIVLKYKLWESDVADFDNILFSIILPINAVLRRSYLEGDKNFFKTTIQSKELHSVDSSNHDRKKFGGLLRGL